MKKQYYTIKETAEMCRCTAQAIYKRQSELIKQGFMITNKKGKYRITDEGLNYLLGYDTKKEIDNFNEGVSSATVFWKNKIKGRIFELEIRIKSMKEEIIKLEQMLDEESEK